MMNSSTIERIATVLKESDKVAVFCHTAPDGDALGCAAVLAMALEKLGKTVCLACDSHVPDLLRILPYKERFEREPTLDKPYVSVAVDCGDAGRLGMLLPHFMAGRKRINIDHHWTNPGFGDLNLVDPDSPATICLVWPLIRDLGAQPDEDMGLAAYIALSTDTGNFSYSNTTPGAFALAAELLKTGFDLASAAESLFRQRTLARAKVIGLCADRMRLFDNGRIAVSGIDAADYQRIGASESDSEGAVDFLRDIDTVEAAAFLREVEPGVFKVSLRSKNALDVSKIAARYEGGGHKNAAGCRIAGTLASAMNEIKDALLQQTPEDR
ncbi:MAG: DHH family phosphoesterase [Christensenellales bacterium]|jgi:phosphoesterase RecJ-like protein